MSKKISQILSATALSQMCGGTPSHENVASFCEGLNRFGFDVGLNHPHRLAQYLGQMMHESAMFLYDREVWGPTPAQARYDTRTDLGNSAARDGDGYKYRGRTSIQITGKFNYGEFTDWARGLDANAPDFVADPDAANTDPWEGLGPIWYWDTRNLNVPADKGDTRRVTKLINGGYNGFADRQRCVDRASLVLLGYGPTDVARFQGENGLVADGKSGPKTRTELHNQLLAMQPVPAASPEGAIGAIAAVTVVGITGLAYGFEQIKIFIEGLF